MVGLEKENVLCSRLLGFWIEGCGGGVGFSVGLSVGGKGGVCIGI
jgi:hypothetical protein